MALIAITGGTGFLGLNLARALTERGHFVKLIARGTDKQRQAMARKMSNVSFKDISLADEGKLFKEIVGCEVVAHLAGINREREPGQFEALHVQGTANLVSAARRAVVQKIVYVSYLRARPSSTSKYLQTKFEAEELVRKSGIDYTIIRPGMVYGCGDQMVNSIARGLRMLPFVGIFPTVGLLEKPVNPIAVDDLNNILCAALVENRLSKQTVAVVGPEDLKLSQAVYCVGRALRRPTLVLPVPVAVQYLVAALMEKTMPNPLLTLAQVRMLSEGMNVPLQDSDLLPSDLTPKTVMNEALVKAALRRD